MLDSLVRVSRRAACNHYASIRAKARSSVQVGRITSWAISRPGGRYIPKTFNQPPKPMLAWLRRNNRVKRPRGTVRLKSGHKRFPFNNFTYCLTLFSKCFSSFDHSTCALSVSGRYLALDGIYHPFGAAFPNNSTRRRGNVRLGPAAERGSHPLRRPVPGDLGRGSRRSTLYKLQLGPHEGQISNLSTCRFTRRY